MTINKWQVVNDPSPKWAKRIRADVVADSKEEILEAMENYQYPFGTVLKSKNKDYNYSFFIYEGDDEGGKELKQVLSGKKPEVSPVSEETEDESEPGHEGIKPVEETKSGSESVSEELESEEKSKPEVSPAPEEIKPEIASPTEEEKIKNERFEQEADIVEKPGDKASANKEELPDKGEDGSVIKTPAPAEERKTHQVKEKDEKSPEDNKEPRPDEVGKKVSRVIKLGVIYSLLYEDVKISTKQQPEGEEPLTEKVYDIFINNLNEMVAKQNIKVLFKLSYQIGYDGLPDKEKVMEEQKEADVLVIIDEKEGTEKLENVFTPANIAVYSMPVKDINKDYEYLNLAADMALRI